MEKRPDAIVNLGDWWDLPALSTYDRGTAKAEGCRVMDDIYAGNLAMNLLLAPLRKLQNRQAKNKKRVYSPAMHFLMGNHENRIRKYENSNPALQGTFERQLDLSGWTVHPFLEILSLQGISFSHYFYGHLTGKALSGTAEYRMSKIKTSFVQGHEQGFRYATESAGDRRLHGLVAGSFYLHEEEYKGPQANNHWRGYCYLNNAKDGDYDLEVISIA